MKIPRWMMTWDWYLTQDYSVPNKYNSLSSLLRNFVEQNILIRYKMILLDTFFPHSNGFFQRISETSNMRFHTQHLQSKLSSLLYYTFCKNLNKGTSGPSVFFFYTPSAENNEVVYDLTTVLELAWGKKFRVAVHAREMVQKKTKEKKKKKYNKLT